MQSGPVHAMRRYKMYLLESGPGCILIVSATWSSMRSARREQRACKAAATGRTEIGKKGAEDGREGHRRL